MKVCVTRSATRSPAGSPTWLPATSGMPSVSAPP